MGCRTLCLLAGAAGISWAASVPLLNVQQLVERSEQAIAEDWSHAPQYSFVERDVEGKHDAQPVVKTYQVLMIDRSPYNRLIAIDDKPLSAADQGAELRKLQNEIQRRQEESERARQRRVDKYLRERHQNSALLKGMLSAFKFQLVGEANVDGHDCWVLDATPKPGYEPLTRETKVLKGMQGRLWIDKDSGQWVKVQAEVVQPVSLYGFFAKVRPGTRFLLEQEPVAPHVWLPKHFSTQVSASALGFFNEDSIDDETYSKYEPMAQTLSQLMHPH
jgi:hypothetical protein